nr:hypothetical protein BaRGS_026179 [Batillaria attramentaria]
MLTRARANRELAHKDLVKRYTGYGVADAWAGVIWNRFPAEIYPLFLTPYIEAERIHEAQDRSRVRGLLHDDVESYSGYITVDKRYQSNMFFWFFPAKDPSNAPVLLWLNGGPGRSSLVGAMLENGPLAYTLLNRRRLKRRQYAWTKHFSMIYVDNPVGAGYSFTRDDAGLSRSKDDIARNLYSTLTQFFKLFPQYSKNDFYAGGQSYAGKYVPALGYYIHQQNHGQHPPEVRINFKGIYLGAGFCSPAKMMPVYPDFLFSMGFVSDSQRRQMKQNNIKLIADGLSGKRLLTVAEYTREFTETVPGVPSDHVMGEKATVSHDLLKALWEDWMDASGTRLALHVGYAAELDSLKAMNALQNEFLLDTATENAFLMDNYKVLHYSGNLDVIVNVPMTEAFLSSVPWSGQAEYNSSSFTRWFLGDDLAGFVTQINNFTRVIVRNSGHMVPNDQPERALIMMERFVFDKPFEKSVH